MTAKEAFNKSLWYQLPIEIIDRINKQIKTGGTMVILYESVEPVIFYNKEKYIDILKQLGYIVNLETVTFPNDKSEDKMTICWKFAELKTDEILNNF